MPLAPLQTISEHMYRDMLAVVSAPKDRAARAALLQYAVQQLFARQAAFAAWAHAAPEAASASSGSSERSSADAELESETEWETESDEEADLEELVVAVGDSAGM